ncbi:MAG: tetratricopeptide repeat protein [Cyclobacteriaceae bacterium]|nr:tetratricopeptide repeat protein [Cyclobacteriaceae bacterium]
MKVTVSLAFALFSLLLTSFGQKTETEVYTMGFKFSSLEKKGANVYTAAIDHGLDIGLKQDGTGTVYGMVRKDVKAHNHKLGTVTWTSVSQNRSVGTIKLNENEIIMDGDLFYVNITVPKRERTSYFFLITEAINVVKDNGEPYYTFEEILEKDGFTLRTEKFLSMQNDIHAAGEKLKQSGYKGKVQAGPYEGEAVYDVMIKTDTLAVWYYVYHLNQMNWETMGQDIRLSEAFKEYVEEGDVASPGLLKTWFVGATKQSMEGKYTQYKRKITKKLLEDWKEDATKFSNDKKFDDAEALLDACIFLSEKMGDENQIGLYFFAKADLYERSEAYDKSLASYQLALDHFTKANNNFTIGHAHQAIGMVQYRLKDYANSLKSFEKAIGIRGKLVKDNPGNVDYLNNMYTTLNASADVTYAVEDYQSSIEIYRAALKFARLAKNKSDEGTALWNHGFVFEEKLKNHDSSLVYYQKAKDIYVDLKDTTSVVTLMRSLAIVNENLKRYQIAKSITADGIALAKKTKNDASLVTILDYQGIQFVEHEDYLNAIKSYKEAEVIYKKLDNRVKLENLKKKLAKCYRETGQYDLAISKFKERLEYIEVDDLSRRADMNWDIALVYGKKGDIKNEIFYYDKSEKDYRQIKDTASLTIVINNMGYAYRDVKDSVNSYKNHERAILLNRDRKDKSDLAYSYEHLANSYKQFDSNVKSIENFRLAQKIYEQLGNFLKAGNMSDDQGHRQVARKQYALAIDRFTESIKLYNRAGDKREEAEAHWDLAYQSDTWFDHYDFSIDHYKTAYGLYMEAGDSVNACVMLSNIGQDHWSKVDYVKAIEYHQKAIALAKACRNNKQVARSWSKLAILYKDSGNPIDGTIALVNAADALLVIKDSVQLGTTYQDIGNTYYKSKDYPKAMDYFDRSITIRKALRDTLNLASALNDLAIVYAIKNDYKNAEPLYSKALVLRRKIKDRDNIPYNLSCLGNLELNVQQDYVKSEKYFLEAEKLAEQTHDEGIQAFIFSQMKWLYRSQGKAALAEKSLQKALDLYKKNKNGKEYANTLVSQSFDVGYVTGDQIKAMKLLDDAQVIADTIKDVMLQASIFGQRGTILRELGEFQKALDYATKSLELYQQIDNDWGIAGVYVDRGNIYKQLNEYDQAIKNQLIADSIYKSIHAEYARLAPIANLGENYSAQGNYVKAMEYYQQTLAISKKANDLNENLAIIQVLIGETHYYLGNPTEAEKWIKLSLATCDQVGAFRAKSDNLGVMGRLKIDEKKFTEARPYLVEGMRLSKEKSLKIGYISNLVLLGKLEVEEKKYAAAKPLLEEAIATSRTMGKNSTLWESLYLLGVMNRETGDLQMGRDNLKESVLIIEKIRNKVSGGEEAQKLFSSDKNILKVYEVLVDVLLQLGETDAAMEYLQKNNEDNLKAKYRGLDIKFQNENKNKVVGQERTMKAKLDGIEQQIVNEKALPVDKQNVAKLKNLEGIQTIAEGDYLKFVNQQVNVQPELSKFFSNSVQPSEFRKRKKQIPKDMALLSYLPGEKQLYIFMATSDTVIAKVVNITREQLARDVSGVMSIVRTQQGTFGKLDLSKEEVERKELVSDQKQTDKSMKPFEELYHYLISPVSAEIANKKKLCIIPNGALSYIPFQLLGKTLQNGKFSLMANQFSIFYANSTDMLLRTLEGGEKDYNILAFGNPDKSLPSTEKEVSDIKKLFPNASIFTGDDATEDKAKFAEEKFNVMHFATHGNLDYEDFSKSYLTMAVNPSKNEDGKLTLEELWGMEVMNHLSIVVLSACQTAVTKGSNESSPVSPASGFLQNGVKSVVATLWKVDDEATSILIGDFYKNIKTMDAVDALRLAQVNLSKNPKFALPYYWAGAILLGDWR